MLSRLKSLRLSRGFSWVLLCACVCGCGSTLAAQQATTSATLGGRIEDPHGGAIGGADITLTNLDKNTNAATVSDGEGRFRFLQLSAGSYQLTVSQAGFSTVSQQFTLSVGQALDVPIRLAVAAVAENVAVRSFEVPLVEISRTQVSDTIQPKELDALPLNGRNYTELALLVPGVSRTNTGSVQRFAETSAVPGTGISVAGQRNLNNSFIVDGLSANDDAAGLAGTFYSQEVIREFQVITSGGIAEFSRASGGFINITTQSGTNIWGGRAYGYLRNQRFDARHPLNPVAGQGKDPLTQAQYGASLGGPLLKNRTFLFTNFEQTRRNDASVITIHPERVSAINALLAQVNYPGPRIETGLVPGGYDVTNFFVRLDHRVNDANSFAARFNLYDLSAVNSRTVGGLNSLSRGTNLDNLDRNLSLSNVTLISARTVNEARFQYSQSRLEAPVNDAVGPAVNINGVASFGTATFSPLARRIDLFEAVNNLSTTRGAHALKGGVNFLYNRVDIFFPGALQGVYTFNTLQNFLAGNYSQFQQAFGAPSQLQKNPNLGLFVQDEWRPRRDLTINAGLRYDAQFLPEPIETDGNNFAPRLGIAYAPGDGKTVMRASYGIYFDRIPLRATSNALQRDGSKYLVAQVLRTDVGAPVFPNVLAAFPTNTTLKPAITTIDPEIENSYTQQLSLQVERELPFDASVSVGYLHLRGLHLIGSRNVNVPPLRPNPLFGNISRFESAGESTYNGLVASFNKRANGWASVRVSYTLSKAIDDAGNFFFSTPQDNFDRRGERGLSDNDQRHRLTVSGSLEAPRREGVGAFRRTLGGFQLSYIFTYASRLPFNVLLGADRNGDTNFNDRPVGVGRNTGRGFDFVSLDLRLARTFHLTERLKLETLAEGFNIFNRTNLQVPNNVFGAGTFPLPSFGQATAAGDPRQFQLGLRLSY